MNTIFKDYKLLEESKRKTHQVVGQGNHIGSELFTKSYMSHLPFYKYDSIIQEEESKYEDNKNHPFRYLRDTSTDEFVNIFLNENNNINVFIQFLYDVLIIEILPSINNEIYYFLNKDSNDANKDNIEYYYNSNIECVKILFKGGTLMNIYQKYLFQYLKNERHINLNDERINNDYSISDKFKNSDTDTNIFIDSYNKYKFNFLYSILSKLLVNTLCSISYILDIFIGEDQIKNMFINELKEKYQKQYDELDDNMKKILSKEEFKFIKLELQDDIHITFNEIYIKRFIEEINKNLYNNTISIDEKKNEVYLCITLINETLTYYSIKNLEVISELINVLKTCSYVINFNEEENKLICDIINKYVNYLECIKMCRIINLDIIYKDFNNKFEELKKNIVEKYNEKKNKPGEYLYKKENKKYYKFCDDDITVDMIKLDSRYDFLLSNLNNQYYNNIEIDKERPKIYNYFNANLNKLYCIGNVIEENQDEDILKEKNIELNNYNTDSNYHYISINTSIIQHIPNFKYTNDFDLYRIKLNLKATNILKEYNDENFDEPHSIISPLIPSEILDVSISKYNDSSRIEHSNELKEKQNNISLYNKKNNKLNLIDENNYLLTDINVYSAPELMHDLSLVLFSQNPNSFITPWEDLKYGKRLLRLFFFLFIFENFNNNNNKCKILIDLNDLINKIYDQLDTGGFYNNTQTDIQTIITNLDITSLKDEASKFYVSLNNLKNIVESSNQISAHSYVGDLVFYQIIEINKEYKQIFLLINYYIFYILFLEYLQNNQEDKYIDMIFKYIYENKYKFFLKLYDNDSTYKRKFLYDNLIKNFFIMIKESKMYLNYFVEKICNKTDDLFINLNTKNIDKILNPLVIGGSKKKKFRLKLKNKKKRKSNKK